MNFFHVNFFHVIDEFFSFFFYFFICYHFFIDLYFFRRYFFMTVDRQMDLLRLIISMTDEERMFLIDSGFFNHVILGYLVYTLHCFDMDSKFIKQAACFLDLTVFECLSATCAKDYFESFFESFFD